MKDLRKRLALTTHFVIFITIGLAIFGTLGFSSKVSAAAIVDFKPGRIIEDSVFINTSTMTQSDIQSFLNGKVPSCDTYGTQTSEYGGGTRAQWAANASLHPTMGAFYPPFTCLKDYVENGKSAAQIIYETAQQFSINPQVLIVMLQKEQGLVTDTWPSPVQYRSATGYGCPDTAPCDSQYYGLTNQLQWTGTMFRAILNDSPTWYTPYNLGNNFIRWSPDASCGGSNVFIENRSTQALYNYTPYQPNQAALNAGYGQGDACSAHGNRNFYLYFRDWFGYNSGPVAFKTADSSTVYIPIENYRVAIPSMALLQDYGISVNSIQIVGQDYLNARTSPPGSTMLSSTLSYVIKSPNDGDEDGGCLYLISRGKRYQFQSMQQLYDFGFSESDISYLPLSNIYSIPNGGLLKSFVTTPSSSEVFKVQAGKKSLYFQYSAYISDNPSDTTSPLSFYLLERLTATTPITSGPVLLKYKDNDAVYIYQNDKYYLAPDYSTFSECWRLDRELALPLFSPSQNDYIASVSPSLTLSCFVNDGTNNILLSGASKLIIPLSYGITGTPISGDLTALMNRLPGTSKTLSQYVKSPSDNSVWLIDSSKKRLIPSYSNFRLLGIVDSNIDVISAKAIELIDTGKIKLADGQVVKTTSSPSVDIISGNSRISYPSSELFAAYKNSWAGIEVYSDAILNDTYPSSGGTVSSYLVDSVQSKAYVIGTQDCYALSQTTLDAIGKSYAGLLSGQGFSSSIFKSINLQSCKSSSLFVKNPSSPLVYWLDSGKKYPLNSYAAMVSKNAGQTPDIMEVTSGFLTTLPTGNVIP